MDVTYRLRHLKVKDFKGIKDAEVDLSGALTIIGGDNAAGKSSLIDALVATIGGGRNEPERPVRNGADEGFGELLIDGPSGPITVRKVFKDDTSKLTIQSAHGMKSTSQSLLNGFLGAAALDPMAWLRLKPREQVDELRKILDVDFGPLDERRRAAYDERTFVNRRLDELKGKFAGERERLKDDVPDEEVSLSAISEAISEALTRNAAAQASARNYEHLQMRIEADRAQLDRLRAEVEKQAAGLRAAEAELAACPAIEAPLDMAPLEARLAGAEETNRQVRLKKALAVAREEWHELGSQAKALTAEITEIDEAKAALVADAKLPVEGLRIADDGVSLSDVPLSQCSSAEQMKLAIALAFCQNPKLKFTIDRDGSLLDKESLEMLAELTVAQGAQLIVERVGSGDECTVILEDGLVRQAKVPA